MAFSTVQTYLGFVVFAITCYGTIGNPIPSNQQEKYDEYEKLVCETKNLWKREHKLFCGFVNDRLPGTVEVKAVDIPNFLPTDNLTLIDRNPANVDEDIELLDRHRDYLLHYKYIIDYVIDDEENTTSSIQFKNNMTEIRLFIMFTIGQLEDVMIHLGHMSYTKSDIPSGSRPYFDPTWEKNVINRYERDLYVLDEMRFQLAKSVQDFSRMRDRYIQVNTVPYVCPYIMPEPEC